MDNLMDDLVGQTFDFYGVCNTEFKLDNQVYEAIEDPDDGWRSYLDTVIKKESDGVFFSAPIARVRVEEEERVSFGGYSLVDVEDGHVWLRFGTEDNDDWYPYFLFQYQCKAEREDK